MEVQAFLDELCARLVRVFFFFWDILRTGWRFSEGLRRAGETCTMVVIKLLSESLWNDRRERSATLRRTDANRAGLHMKRSDVRVGSRARK